MNEFRASKEEIEAMQETQKVLWRKLEIFIDEMKGLGQTEIAVSMDGYEVSVKRIDKTPMSN